LVEGSEQNVGILANIYDIGRVDRWLKLKSTVYVVIFSENLKTTHIFLSTAITDGEPLIRRYDQEMRK
jgi:hypothetical protein